MGSRVKNPHDTRLKELFKNKAAFVSLLKDCVKADWFESLDVDSLRRNDTSFILPDFKKKEADIIYEATLGNGRRKVIFYLLLELQSRVDYRMPYRLLLYMVEILRHYYNGPDKKLRLRKDFKFPAVVPIVFYSGSRKWTVPANLRDMFDGKKRFGSSLLNFDYVLVDAKGYDDESVKDFQSKLLKVMMMFEKSGGVDDLIRALRKYEGEIKLFDEEELRIIKSAIAIFGSVYGTPEINELCEVIISSEAEGVSFMLSDLAANVRKRDKQLIKQGIGQGISQGIRQEKIDTAKALLSMGLPVERVAEGTRMTAEEVERIRKEMGC